MIPDSSGEFSRNDVRAGIAPELQVLRPYHMVLRTMLALQRPLNESLLEFRWNSGIPANSVPARLWRCPGIYPEFPSEVWQKLQIGGVHSSEKKDCIDRSNRLIDRQYYILETAVAHHRSNTGLIQNTNDQSTAVITMVNCS
jgi:hypothetical protein